MNPIKLLIASLILSAAKGATVVEIGRVLRSKTYATAAKAGKSAGYAKSSKSGYTSTTIQTKPGGESGGNIIVTVSSSIDVSNVFITSSKRARRQLITQDDFKTLMDETIREVVTGSLTTATQNLTSEITTGTKPYIVNGTVVGTTSVSQLVFEEKCTSSCTEQLQTTTLSRTVISYLDMEVKNGDFTKIFRENAADELGLDDVQNASVVGGTFNETGTSIATSSPTKVPTSVPTALPSQQPTTESPTSPKPITYSPTRSPTSIPTAAPTRPPTEKPTTISPTSSKPSASPTKSPTSIPTSAPSTQSPTTTPTNSPSFSPTRPPSSFPTSIPTTRAPSATPTTLSPTSSKPTTVSPLPPPPPPPLSGTPTSSPVTKSPTSTSPPVGIPTKTPSATTLNPAASSSKPSTVTANPTTKRPTTNIPTTIEPTDIPTVFPTYNPTSDAPTTTDTPTDKTVGTETPTDITEVPTTTETPTVITETPTVSPATETPTDITEVPTTTETPTVITETPTVITETPTISPVIEITVSGGAFPPLPIYTFTVGGSALDVTTYEFIPGSKYKFVGGSTLNTNHPFFISDQGRLTASSSFDITSRKAYNTGIKVGESLEFQLPLDFSGTLTYYCVPHAEMTKTFKVASSATTTTMTTRFETRTIVNLERKRNRVGFF